MCVSGQYHQYCSAHDEWLIMKRCMYVRYHTANNVSNCVGGPVTQLNLINLIVCVCIRGHVAIIARRVMNDFGGDPVTHLHFITTFNVMSPYCSVHDEWLIMKLWMYVSVLFSLLTLRAWAVFNCLIWGVLGYGLELRFWVVLAIIISLTLTITLITTLNDYLTLTPK